MNKVSYYLFLIVGTVTCLQFIPFGVCQKLYYQGRFQSFIFLYDRRNIAPPGHNPILQERKPWAINNRFGWLFWLDTQLWGK
jgi:hypothetical protein